MSPVTGHSSLASTATIGETSEVGNSVRIVSATSGLTKASAMGVEADGANAFALMPCSAPSTAMDRIMPYTPAFAIE